MKTLISCFAIFICFSFVSGVKNETGFNLLEGKWQLIGTDVNGTRDTAQSGLKAVYYEFNEQTGFTISWIRNDDSTEYKIGGTYRKDSDQSLVKVKVRDKDKTKTKYTVEKLTTDSLSLSETRSCMRYSPVVYTTHFVRVK